MSASNWTRILLMRNDDSIRKIIFMVILNFVMVILVVYPFSGSSYGQLKTLSELAKHTPNQNAAIPVGTEPIKIGIYTFLGKVYVANNLDGIVSIR